MNRPERAADSPLQISFNALMAQNFDLPPLRGGGSFYRYLGLKPQAESYYPFGLSPTGPTGRPLLLSSLTLKNRFPFFEERPDAFLVVLRIVNSAADRLNAFKCFRAQGESMC